MTFKTVGATFQSLFKEEDDSAQADVSTQTAGEEERTDQGCVDVVKTPEQAISYHPVPMAQREVGI